MRAAEGTSAAVVASGESWFPRHTLFGVQLAPSDAEIVRPNHDLTYQLTARKERLSWLIRFINDNGALGKVSVTLFFLSCKRSAFITAEVETHGIHFHFGEHPYTHSCDPSRCLKEVVNA